VGLEKLCLCGITAHPPKKAISKTALGAEEAVPWEHDWDAVRMAEGLRSNGFQIAAIETSLDSLRTALKQHERRASMALELEEKVAAVVKKLKERGLVSPYLRSFVVARINPLRWVKGDPPPLKDVLKTMRERVAKFNVEKIKPQDLAGAAGPPDEET
jgi:DNA-binding transcriptional MerR regulator